MGTTFDLRLSEAVDAAERVFSEHGYGMATMRDVADAAGLSIAGLYYYLPSKEHALYLVCERAFGLLSHALDAVLEAVEEPEQRLYAFVRGHIDFFTRNPHAYRVLLHGMDGLQGERRTSIHALRRAYFSRAADLVADLQRKYQSAVSTHVATAALFGMMNWTPMWFRDDERADAAPIAQEMSDLFLRGVQTGATKCPEWASAPEPSKPWGPRE